MPARSIREEEEERQSLISLFLENCNCKSRHGVLQLMRPWQFKSFPPSHPSAQVLPNRTDFSSQVITHIPNSFVFPAILYCLYLYCSISSLVLVARNNIANVHEYCHHNTLAYAVAITPRRRPFIGLQVK